MKLEPESYVSYSKYRLKYVDFSDNCLTSLPGTIQHLKNLKYLRLAGNWFRFLNEEMMWVKSLEFLDISRNQLQVCAFLGHCYV